MRLIHPGPSDELVTITPADAVIAGGPIRSLYVGGAGNVTVRDMLGTIVTFTAVPAGTILPVMVDQVRLTGTTATAIVGLR